MERFWCYLVGFAIALVLVAGFLIVKMVVEEYREKAERTVNEALQRTKNELYETFNIEEDAT